MSKINDDLGYRIKIPKEALLAINLVDNGIDPYKKMKKTSLHHKVENEYKRRSIINILAFMRKSSKNAKYVYKKLKIRKKSSNHLVIKSQLDKINWKKLDKLHKQILQVGRTKKTTFPKSRKTRRKR
jgi:glutamyl/glutaminyl-tRNA synthetase